jgi:hypothetical protein
VSNWNKGKLEEFRQRKTFIVPETKENQATEWLIKPALRGGEKNNVNTEF